MHICARSMAASGRAGRKGQSAGSSACLADDSWRMPVSFVHLPYLDKSFIITKISKGRTKHRSLQPAERARPHCDQCQAEAQELRQVVQYILAHRRDFALQEAKRRQVLKAYFVVEQAYMDAETFSPW